MFSGSTHLLPTISNYYEARKHWDETKKPRGTKWETYQRPLKDGRSHHYRMESLDPESYIDLVLYRTTMARFYHPDAGGNERRLYIGHHSLTSRKFMSDVLGLGLAAPTADGGVVAAPVYGTHCVVDQGDAFSANFWYTRGNKLIVDKSRHTRHWQKVSNADDKAARAALRQRWSTYLTLAMFRMPEFIESVDLHERNGRPFGGVNHGWRMAQAVDKINAALMVGAEPEAEEVDQFFAYCQRIFDTLASKRGYAQPGFVMESWHTKAQLSPYSELAKPITPQELVKSIEGQLFKRLSLNTRSGLVELPQFMPSVDYPRSNVLAKENP